ncbi:MAG: proline--tRNA ligase, partial [Brevundimonas sp.]
MKAKVAGPDGQDAEVHMGSYGVGVSRLLGAIIEASHDEGGIIWPDAVAPFDVVVINLRANDAAVSAACEDAVAQLEKLGKDVLYDDTDERPGGKFATADLIGVPWQLTIGPKGLADGVVELKRRATGEKVSVPLAEAIERLTA